MTVAEKIKKARDWSRPSLSQDDLSRLSGVNRSTIARYENNAPVPTAALQRLADALRLPMGWFLDGADTEPPFGTAPLVARERRQGYDMLDRPKIPVGFPTVPMRYAGEVPTGEWGDPLASEEFIEVEVQFEGPRRFAAKVVGDSCYPALLQGDVTVWESDLSPSYGTIVLAQRKGDHSCTVKELAYDETAGRPRLRPVNPAHSEPEDGEGWGAIARLVAVLRPGPTRRTWFSEYGLKPKDLTSTV